MCYTLFMNNTATISSKGQITLPVKIRRSLNLDSGDRIKITKKGQKIIIAPDTYEEKLADLRARTAKHLKDNKIKPLKTEDLDKTINQAWSEASIERFNRAN